MNRVWMLALVLAASNAFAAMPSVGGLISDGEEFVPACYPLGMPLEPHCRIGGDIVN